MNAVQKLAALVESVGGVVTPERELGRLESLAHKRADAAGCDTLDAYVELLEKFPEGEEWRRLLRSYTVKESYLFRAHRQFEILAAAVLPEIFERRNGPIKLWSAGCAHGEEPASMAVVLANEHPLIGQEWTVLGTDIDEEALSTARLGRFPSRAMRRVPKEMVQRFFLNRGQSYELRPEFRAKISYRYLNLIRDPLALEGGPFDVIFLRNVLIYFNRENQRRVVERVADHLSPEGSLFVGPSESLWQVTSGLEVHEIDGCFVYRRRKRGPKPAKVPGSGTVPSMVDAAPVSAKGVQRHALEVGGDRASGDPAVHIQAGLAADWQGRLAEAIRHYRAASYLEPELVEARFLLARCFRRCGWTRRARAEFRAALDLIAGGRAQQLPGANDLGLPSLGEIEKDSRRALENSDTGK